MCAIESTFSQKACKNVHFLPKNPPPPNPDLAKSLQGGGSKSKSTAVCPKFSIKLNGLLCKTKERNQQNVVNRLVCAICPRRPEKLPTPVTVSEVSDIKFYLIRHSSLLLSTKVRETF